MGETGPACDLSVREELRDITECIVCKETFADPRVLPCIHTFCLGCLERILSATATAAASNDAASLTCPICRRDFPVPHDGPSGLPKNFFMERLVKMTTVLNPRTQHNLCEACLEDAAALDVAPAEAYCVDCRQKLCDECLKLHKRNRVLKAHKIITANSSVGDDVLESFAPSLCDRHEKEHLKIYCKECHRVLCALCFLEEHQFHGWLDAKEVVEEFRASVGRNRDQLSACLVDIRDRRCALETDKAEVLRLTESLESSVVKASAELRARTDEDTRSVLLELSALKQGRLKDIETQNDDVERRLAMFESFVRYCDELRTKGSASDICRTLGDLETRAEELARMHDTFVRKQLPTLQASFEKADTSKLLSSNVIGNITVSKCDGECSDSSDRRCAPTTESNHTGAAGAAGAAGAGNTATTTAQLAQEINRTTDGPEITGERTEPTNSAEASMPPPEGALFHKDPVFLHAIRASQDQAIWGLTILKDEIFIARERRTNIDVYDVATMWHKRRIPSKGDFRNPRDIVACTRHQCLYVMDWMSKGSTKDIWKLEPAGSVLLKWSTGDDRGLLSTTDEGTVILAVTNRQKLNEYSADGQLVREVFLSSHVVNPWHAVRMPNGNFVVSQDDDRVHRICVVDGDGGLVGDSFSGEDVGPLKGSVYLGLSRDGTVLVGDSFRGRVLALSSDMRFRRSFLTKTRPGYDLRCPVRMHLAEASGRLYVVDNDYDYLNKNFKDGRVLVFDIGH